jgi:ribosomal protein S27AE
MWASSIPKTIEKKKTPAATLPLEKYLANARLEFQEQRKEIPKLLREVQTLKKKTEAMTHRYQIRIVKDTQLHIKELEKEVEIRQSMQRENEYEHIIAPYLNAYNQRVEISQAKNDIPRNITAPGCGKKKETIDSYVQQYDATATRQNAIVNEYLMQVSDESPKLALHTRDDCPLCNETLMLINSKAIMTCPKCGYSVTYLDATMSSMSYSDDVEFSSFSYKRINHFNEWLQQVQAK